MSTNHDHATETAKGEPQNNSVEKVPDLFNSQVLIESHFPAANAPVGVEKVAGFFNEQDVFATQQVTCVVVNAGGMGPPPTTIAPPSSEVYTELLDAIPPPAPLRSGRPPVLTSALMEQLCLLLSVGLSRRQAAAYLDIDHSTISHAAARDEDFARQLQRTEELAAVQPVMVLLGQSRTNWRAAAWLMDYKRKYPPALSEEEKIEANKQRLADRRREFELKRGIEMLRVESEDLERQEKFAYERRSTARPSRTAK